jgi:hypothetical protein
MKKNLIFVILVLIFIAGCSSLDIDSRGFYLSGEKKGLHNVTGTKYDLEGYCCGQAFL